MKIGTKVRVYDSRLKGYCGSGTIEEKNPNGMPSVLVRGKNILRHDEYSMYNEIVVHKNQCCKYKRKKGI